MSAVKRLYCVQRGTARNVAPRARSITMANGSQSVEDFALSRLEQVAATPLHPPSRTAARLPRARRRTADAL